MTSLLAPDTASTTAGWSRSLTGLGITIRLALRRGRWFWLAWILGLWATIAATASAYERLIPDAQTGAATMQTLAGNVTMRAMLGPPFDLLNPGGFVMWRVGTFVAAGAGMMAALGVIRATRAEEEEGRIELLRSGSVGRHAPLAGGLVVALFGCLALTVLITLTLARSAPPSVGALATGLGIGLAGAVFGGVAAVAAQLTESARAARGIALGNLGAAYLVRAVADGSSEGSPLRALQWVSPVEWAALVRPYAGERWAVLVLPLVLTAALVALAFRLESGRDHGSGLRAARPGPATASPALSSAAGLAWRLHRGSIVGWTIAVALGGVALGSLSGAMDQLLADNPQLAEMFRRMGGGADALREAFYVAMLAILAVVLAMFGLQILGRLRREEEQGHAEALLATSTSRTRLAVSHLAPALVLPTVLLALSGGLLAVPYALGASAVSAVGEIAVAGLVLAPGVWLVVGLGMALHGWTPRLGVVAWLVLAWSLFVVWVGGLLDLPQRVLDATPFATLSQLPVEPLAWTPTLTVTALALALAVLGLAGYSRRDIATA